MSVRNFFVPGRSPVYATEAMVATSHPLASACALDALRRGGSAMDAALAAVAVQCVVEPHMTGIGGDCFCLIKPPGAPVEALNGSGRMARAIDADALCLIGREAFDASAHAITIPAALAGWAKLHVRHGRLPWADVFRAAIDYAEHGFVVAPRVAYDWQLHAARLERSLAARTLYLPADTPPLVGARHRLPALAATLRRVANDGADAFYQGALAERMVASLRSYGGVHSIDDFAAATADWVTPISTTYRGVEVFECPPNGQGIVALAMLNMLECLDLAGLDPDGAERLHLEAEVTRLAYADRDAWLADDGSDPARVAAWLDKAAARGCVAQIDPAGAMQPLGRSLLPPHPDTVYVSVVDADGMAVSLINSIFDSFGSGYACPATGVLFHNRGRHFSLDLEHPNALAPGKRPMHTIMPALALKNGELWASFGVMGGDYQPVGQVHVLTGMLDFGLDPQAALDAPRAFAFLEELQVEAGLSLGTIETLRSKGHKTVPATRPWGGGQIIRYDAEHGVLIGGSDPRKDGMAIGY
ncbi:MAG: gamma-glutamyltransferase family protein [Geminicoccaceae bacterium]